MLDLVFSCLHCTQISACRRPAPRRGRCGYRGDDGFQSQPALDRDESAGCRRRDLPSVHEPAATSQICTLRRRPSCWVFAVPACDPHRMSSECFGHPVRKKSNTRARGSSPPAALHAPDQRKDQTPLERQDGGCAWRPERGLTPNCAAVRPPRMPC